LDELRKQRMSSPSAVDSLPTGKPTTVSLFLSYAQVLLLTRLLPSLRSRPLPHSFPHCPCIRFVSPSDSDTYCCLLPLLLRSRPFRPISSRVARGWQIRDQDRKQPFALDLGRYGEARRPEARPKPRSLLFPRSSFDGSFDLCATQARSASSRNAPIQHSRGSAAALQSV